MNCPYQDHPITYAIKIPTSLLLPRLSDHLCHEQYQRRCPYHDYPITYAIKIQTPLPLPRLSDHLCHEQYQRRCPYQDHPITYAVHNPNDVTPATIIQSSMTSYLFDLNKRPPATPQEKLDLDRAIAATDHQIDSLVYQLYDLTPAEIALIEGQPSRGQFMNCPYQDHPITYAIHNSNAVVPTMTIRSCMPSTIQTPLPLHEYPIIHDIIPVRPKKTHPRHPSGTT